MYDENTGEEPKCPFCGVCGVSDDDCGHIVASFDTTFNEEHVNQDEFWRIKDHIRDSFTGALRGKMDLVFASDSLNGLWKRAIQEWDGEDAHLEGYCLYPFLGEVLLSCGAHELEGAWIDPGGPGMTSAVDLYYAEDPSKVLELSTNKIKNLLARAQKSAV